MALRQPAEQLLPAAAKAGDFRLRRVEPGDELPQIGPGDEHAGLGRADHQAGQIVASLELVEMLLELVEHVPREDVRARCGSSSVSTAMSGSGNDSESVVVAAMRIRIPQNVRGGAVLVTAAGVFRYKSAMDS